MEKIVVAGGCFWGVEEYFHIKPYIIQTEVGYANGNTKNPTYEEVCSKTTGFAEVCYMEFKKDTPLNQILEDLFKVIDPTSLNKQGNDTGSQYRTGIYYYKEEQKKASIDFIKNKQQQYSKPIVVEVLPLINYYKAEEYHQRYLKKNPNGYCHIPKDLLKL